MKILLNELIIGFLVRDIFSPQEGVGNYSINGRGA